MAEVLVVTDKPGNAQAIRKICDRAYPAAVCDLADLTVASIDGAKAIIFTFNELNQADIQQIKTMTTPGNRRHKCFFAIASRTDRGRIVQAESMGIRGTLFPEDGPDAIYSALAAVFAEDYGAALAVVSPTVRDAFLASSEFLEGVACSLRKIKPLPIRQLGPSADKIAAVVREEGLAEWIKAVDIHHNQTVRHSIAVAGYAAAFGEALDLVETDIRLLAMSGLLHDLGKMLLPASLLDKVERLDRGEIATIAEHPVLGAKILQNQRGVDRLVVDAVHSHHELLDGSGYPLQISGEMIPPLVRMVTIADIFAALTERRSDKEAYDSRQAIAMMAEMADKLDKDLLAVFRNMVLRTTFARSREQDFARRKPKGELLAKGLHPLLDRTVKCAAERRAFVRGY